MQVLGHGVAHEGIGNFPGGRGASCLAEGLQKCRYLREVSLNLENTEVGSGSV